MSDDEMKYGMLGEDSASTADKLAKYTGEVDWSYLRPHFQAGVLFFVDPELSLEEVGEAFCQDDAEKVTGWTGRGDLVKIGDLHAQQWENGRETFRALVVSPFVLCQVVSSP